MNLRDAVLGKNAKKLEILLDTLEGDEFGIQYFKVLEYFQPKLQRKEVIMETEEDLTIEVTYIESKASQNGEAKKETNQN